MAQSLSYWTVQLDGISPAKCSQGLLCLMRLGPGEAERAFLPLSQLWLIYCLASSKTWQVCLLARGGQTLTCYIKRSSGLKVMSNGDKYLPSFALCVVWSMPMGVLYACGKSVWVPAHFDSLIVVIFCFQSKPSLRWTSWIISEKPAFLPPNYVWSHIAFKTILAPKC